MANPWMKKNPFMSMWLSGFNAAAGSMRGPATAQVKRQATSVMTRASNDIVDAWTAALTAPSAQKRKRRR